MIFIASVDELIYINKEEFMYVFKLFMVSKKVGKREFSSLLYFRYVSYLTVLVSIAAIYGARRNNLRFLTFLISLLAR